MTVHMHLQLWLIVRMHLQNEKARNEINHLVTLASKDGVTDTRIGPTHHARSLPGFVTHPLSFIVVVPAHDTRFELIGCLCEANLSEPTQNHGLLTLLFPPSLCVSSEDCALRKKYLQLSNTDVNKSAHEASC